MSNKQIQGQGWLARLEQRLFEASLPQVVQGMRHEASVEFRALVRDLKAPMVPGFEREVARTLNAGGQSDLIPAETLMPEMMARFTLTREAFDGEPSGYAELERVCNRCPAVGRCWKAMRAGASREACRAFCPNAAAFEHRAMAAAS